MKPVTPDNTHMVIPATDEEGQPRLEQAVRGKPNRFTPKVAAIRHFQIITKEGYNPRLFCWCQTWLEVDYFAAGIEAMTAKLNSFLDEHESCEAKEQ